MGIESDDIKGKRMESIEYKDYYIAFLDILGFKDLVSKKSCAEILSILEKVKHGYSVVSSCQNDKWEELPNSRKQYTIHNKIISDSICLYVDAQEPNNIILLMFACCLMQYELLKCTPPIFVRGGITKGCLYSDGNIIFGPGLTQAYLMEEQNARVPRIIVNQNIISQALDVTPEMQDNVLIFKDYDEFYVVNYFSRLSNCEKEAGLREHVLKYINNILGSTIDSSLREKYVYVKNNILKYSKQ